MFEYKAKLLTTHDGDTIRVLLDQGLREYRDMAIRFYGINAPELRTADGVKARDHLVALIGSETALVIRTIKDAADKYGERWDGKVWLESAGTWGPDNQFVVTTPSLSEQMLADGFAVKYP